MDKYIPCTTHCNAKCPQYLSLAQLRTGNKKAISRMLPTIPENPLYTFKSHIFFSFSFLFAIFEKPCKEASRFWGQASKYREVMARSKWLLAENYYNQ